MLGLRASDAGRRGWRRQLTLGMQNGAQPSLPAALQPAVLARPTQAGQTHLSLHLQPGLRNASDERLGDMGVTLSTLAMVMPQQGAQGAGRDISGEGEFLLITWVAGGAESGG